MRRIFRGLTMRIAAGRRARAAYDRGGPAMPDLTARVHPGQVRRWVAIDQRKFSIVAAVLPPDGGKPEVFRIEMTERAICRFVDKLGGSAATVSR